jgi:hypothetical protein
MVTILQFPGITYKIDPLDDPVALRINHSAARTNH